MKTPSKKLSIFLIAIGCISVILGTIGIFLPILPTTPFLLLAAACFTKGSPKLYNKLLKNPVLGSYIKNYREGKGIPLASKIFTIALLWITMSISIVFFVENLIIRLLLIFIAVCVTTHLLTIKTALKTEETETINLDTQDCLKEAEITKEALTDKA